MTYQRGRNPQNRRPRAPFEGKPCGSCRERGIDFTPADSEDLKVHLVAIHGWKRDGNAVYKTRICEICPKPAFHQYGIRYFCEDHKKYAVYVAQKTGVFVNKRMDVRDDEIQEMNQARDASRKFHAHNQRLGAPRK